ncbi:MAG: VWA domain-containing protein [Anaerolineae bacterium]|nr:VWA domain-containing protein [Anaerolineae bacterium]
MTHTRMFTISLLVTVLIACLPQAVLADGMVIPLAAETGYLVVRYHHVTVDIEDTLATTHVDQAFHNPHPFDVTARYLFPIPPDAMVTDFTATVGGQAQRIDRQDAAATNEMLAELVASRHDPSLLQYADWETLVFEITVPAGQTRTMTLDYAEVLTPNGGLAHYHYVLSTERYSSDLLEEASITVNLNTTKALGTIYTSSHTVATERLDGNTARVSWEATYVLPTEDFHLFFGPAEGGFGSGLLTGRQPGLEDEDERDHFLFLFEPEITLADVAPLPKDIVFVIDRSGSMEGEKIVQAQDALQFILGQLNANDRFSIVGFDDRLDVFSRTLRPVDTETLRDARHFVDSLTARDSTDLDAALAEGLGILRGSEQRRGTTRLLVFLTDGLPTAGVTDPAGIAARAGRNNRRVEARLHVFGVGYDVNTHLLDRLAAENGGSVTYVQPGENLELVLTDFYRRIARPVLTDVEITFEGIRVADLHPATLPDMFEGSSLLLSGRYEATSKGDDVIVQVRGRSGDEIPTFTYRFALSETGDHAFVPQLWATRQIGALLDKVRVEGETDALVASIRKLGLTYGLVTPYTTFIIAAQTGGAASAENMALYGDQTALNQASGQTTIQARVQNQSYQQAAQANLATGANVTKSGHQNLAQISRQHVDLRLLQDQEALTGVITDEWIAGNIQVDRQVDFGSKAYFELAADPEARAFLQAGNNVLFQYQGDVIQIIDEEASEDAFEMAPLAPGQADNLQAPGSNYGPSLVPVQPTTRNVSIFQRVLDFAAGVLAQLESAYDAVVR